MQWNSHIYSDTLQPIIAVMLDIVCNSSAFSPYLPVAQNATSYFLKADLWQASLLIDNSLCLNKSSIFKQPYVFWLTCHHSWVKKEDFQGMIAVCRSQCVCVTPSSTPTAICFLPHHDAALVEDVFILTLTRCPRYSMHEQVRFMSRAPHCCVVFFSFSFFKNPITVGYSFSIRQLKYDSLWQRVPYRKWRNHYSTKRLMKPQIGGV